MATDKDILTGALNRMAAFSTNLPIAWPGVNFTRPAEGMWFEVRHFPNETVNVSWEASSQNRYIGFVQVSVFTRPGEGIVNLTEEAEKIQAHFPKGLHFGPVQVSKRPHQSPPITDDGFIFIPVTIRYLGTA